MNYSCFLKPDCKHQKNKLKNFDVDDKLLKNSNNLNESWMHLNPSCALIRHSKACLIRAVRFDKFVQLNKRAQFDFESSNSIRLGQFQRGCCQNGPHLDKVVCQSPHISSKSSNHSIYPVYASFDGIDLHTGLSVQIDEWIYYCPVKSTKFDFTIGGFSNNLIGRLNHLARLNKHENLCPIIAVDCTQHLPASGKLGCCLFVYLFGYSNKGILNLQVGLQTRMHIFVMRKRLTLSGFGYYWAGI